MRNSLAIAALSLLLGACAAPFPHGHAGHGAAGMDPQEMERMHARMHERMAAAGAPAEREAMMQEHRRMMREHMQGMGGMCGGGMEGRGAGPHQH